MIYRDRDEAARALIQRLTKYRGQHPLVLAIPRGAVRMGKTIAGELGGDLDVVLVRKLRAPENPELAVGSVDESGNVYLTEYARSLGVGEDYLAREKELQLDLIRRRRDRYTPVRPPLDPKNRTVIVVDDGVATGSTLISALRAVRVRQPLRLVVAVGVAPPETYDRLCRLADEVVCPIVSDSFHAVGQFYEDFSQSTDEEVVEILRADPKTHDNQF